MSRQTIDISAYLNIPSPEAFNFLNVNVVLNKSTNNLKTILITSYKDGEGKTTVAMNTAIASAQSGLKTLYVNADLRKKDNTQHIKENVTGLSNYLALNPLEEIIADTIVENLSYVGVGTNYKDPVEFFYGKDFDAFLRMASSQYDIVFIDSSSVGSYVDSAIIASKVSGVLIIAIPRKTTYQNIERIKWQMEKVKAHTIGIVLNRVPRMDYKSYYNSK